MMMSATLESDRTSAREELDRSLSRLKEKSPVWARLAIEDKRRLVRAAARGVAAEAEAWVRTGTRAKGLPKGSGEEWLAGPLPTLRNLRLLEETLERLTRSQPAVPPHRVSTRADGRVEVDVLPVDGKDAILFAGMRVYQLMEPQMSEQSVIEKAGRIYHRSEPPEGVALILAAGNVSSIPPTDALYKLFAEGQVALIKMNPVNEWVGPHLERAFRPLIEAGFIDIVYGGGDVGAYLVAHPYVDEVHITGSNHTHDRIVWGPPGPERERRKSAQDPLLKKRITSELGNVSPVVVTPTTYTPRELRFLAMNVASMVTNNASFNCNAAKILVISSSWTQRETFLGHLSEALATVPTRLAYYPGAMDRYRSLTEGRERVERIGEASPTKLPWTIIHDLDPENRGDPAFSTEPFCGLISVVGLPEKEPAAFLDAALQFLNETLWGTLNAMLVVPSRLERSVEVETSLQRAIVELRYGTVAVNQWPAFSYATCSPAWGGHPSSTLEDVQSGRGWVHNTFLLEGIEKTVFRAPLTLFPTPMWFPSHRKQAAMGKKMVQMEASPSWLKLPGLVFSALQG